MLSEVYSLVDCVKARDHLPIQICRDTRIDLFHRCHFEPIKTIPRWIVDLQIDEARHGNILASARDEQQTN
jgi:hypothetical protein